MHPRVAENRRYWDHLASITPTTSFYDVDGFVAGRVDIDPVVGNLLGEVAGLRVLHLQCHFGMDTLALARRGARVAGVDFSPRAVAEARNLAARMGLEARFFEADVQTIDLGETFDLAFSSWGAVGWLPDLRPWAATVRRHLAPNGRFVLVEGHPYLWTMGESLPLVPTYDYFGGEEIVTGPKKGFYADPDAEVPYAECGWNHPVAELVSVLLAEGLVLTRLEEGDRVPWKAFEGMIQEGVYWRLPDGTPRVPLALTIEVRRPVSG